MVEVVPKKEPVFARRLLHSTKCYRFPLPVSLYILHYKLYIRPFCNFYHRQALLI